MKGKNVPSQVKGNSGHRRRRKRIPLHMKHMEDQLPGWGQGLREWCDVVRPTAESFQEGEHRADVPASSSPSPDVGHTYSTLFFHLSNPVPGSNSASSPGYFPSCDIAISPPSDPPVRLREENWQMPPVTLNTSGSFVADGEGIMEEGSLFSDSTSNKPSSGGSLDGGHPGRIYSSDPFYEPSLAKSIDRDLLPYSEMPHPNYRRLHGMPDVGIESVSPLGSGSSPAWPSSLSLDKSHRESYRSNYNTPLPYASVPADTRFLENSLDTNSARLSMVGHTQSQVSRNDFIHTPEWSPSTLDPGQTSRSQGLMHPPPGFPDHYSFSLDPCYDRDPYINPPTRNTSGASSSSNRMCSGTNSGVSQRYGFQSDLRSYPGSQGMAHPTQSGNATLPFPPNNQYDGIHGLSMPFRTIPFPDAIHSTQSNNVPPQSFTTAPSTVHIHRNSHSTPNNLEYTDRVYQSGYSPLPVRSAYYCGVQDPVPPDSNRNRPSPY